MFATLSDNAEVFVTSVTFQLAMDKLLFMAKSGAGLAIMEQRYEDLKQYEVLIADIRDITEDPSIMDDPDLHEEMEFYGPNGTIWYIQED